jgi:hypothetical protein
VLGTQHPQSIADGQAWSHDQEPLGEAGILGTGHLIQRLPGDEHRHHHGLAGTGGHLQRDPVQPGVVLLVLQIEPVADPDIPRLLRGLGQVDGRLSGLQLAEKHRVVSLGVGPVLQQPPRYRGHIGTAQLPPARNPRPDVVDELVLLDLIRG